MKDNSIKISTNDICVIFSSCEKYMPIWNNFFDLFFRYMPNFNYRFYGTVSYDFSYKEVVVAGNHYLGKDQSFSTRLLKTLQNINDEYVLFFLDDFYLIDFVDKHFLLGAIDSINKNPKIQNIILKDFITNKTRCDKNYNNMFSIVRKKAPFRCTTQVGFFNRKYLISLLRKGENAWEFEFFGSYRASKYNKLVLYRNDEFHNSISYFDAGYLKKGKFNSDYEAFANLNKLTKFDLSTKKMQKNVNKKINIIKKIKVTLRKIYDLFYPSLSVHIKFIKRNGGSIPEFIKKANLFSKDDVMK